MWRLQPPTPLSSPNTIDVKKEVGFLEWVESIPSKLQGKRLEIYGIQLKTIIQMFLLV